ncbi:MAG: hypothetical protein FWC50_16320 [Planctomycetaceae bacterium]|nr:hypothetical protein [Planctomycetaceae bacterium]
MPLFFPGKTECKICKKPIEHGDRHYGFSPFVSNDLDPLVIFNDAMVHQECGNNSPLVQKALERYQFVRSFPNNCRITGEPILNPDDLIVLGFLTEDSNHPLFPYNCAKYLRKNFKTWEKNKWLIEQLEEYDASGLWGGDVLKRLIQDLKKIIGS